MALTRYAARRPTGRGRPGGGEFEAALAACRRIHRDVLAAGRPGTTVGDVLTVLEDSYRAEGHPGAWRQHYQGGPIGYAQREFEISPAQTGDPWWGHRLAAGTAVAWNPSLPGGAKDEDTYLVTATGPDLVTWTGDWPDGGEVPEPTPRAGADPAADPRTLLAWRPGVLVAGE